MGPRAGNRSPLHMLLLAIVLVRGRCLLRRCSLDGSEQTDSRNGCRKRTDSPNVHHDLFPLASFTVHLPVQFKW
jgi:hypothetical protein